MAKIKNLGVVSMQGMLGDKNASAVTFWKDRVLVVADEITDMGNVVQTLVPDGQNFVAEPQELTILDEPNKPVEEMDLEGLAIDGNFIYVLGSHSSRRKKIEPAKKYKKNVEIVAGPPELQPARDVLLRFELDADVKAGPIQRTSLRDFLNSNEPFKSFGAIASKENGVDAEGLAVWKGKVYVGFRGPVLRGNLTPILRFKFGVPISQPQVLFVNLSGRGVRDLAQVADGLLILAGPVGDGPGSYQIYLWDGRDGVLGIGAPTTVDDPGIRLIGELPMPDASAGELFAKPEGVALIKETQANWDILVVFDGLKDGHATRFRVPKN